MANQPSLMISLAAEFTGNKAFKKADTATDKLSKNVKNLGRNLGLALSAGAMLSFARSSIRAAAADEKAQKQLALALTNVGLARDVSATEAYIGKLQKEFGILDDDLRPAYQTLAIATKDTATSQNLMNVALDVAAANSLDIGVVTKALSKAYLGNNAALGKLGIGISKADLKAGKFDDIVVKLSKTFKGAAAASADTFSGKMARLGVTFANVQEIIGKGLIDSFMILSGSADIDELQIKIEAFATSAAEGFKKLAGFVKENLTLLTAVAAVLTATFIGTKLVVGIAALVTAIGTINKAFQALRATALVTAAAEMFALNPIGGAFMVAGMLAFIAASIKGFDALTGAAEGAAAATEGAITYDADEYKNKIKGLEKEKNIEKIITAEERKQLNLKKLQLAIDKAKLALGKGEDVFNLEKIQQAAAEKNQAEQLAKATDQSQLLQITNDMARLRVKKDIDDLEAAIAAKDIKAIESGTARLNKDLGILGALTGQELKMRDLESILKSIVPKDLINLANLDEALAKLKLLGNGVITPVGSPTPTATQSKPLLEMLAAGSFVPVVGGGGYSSSAGAYASSGFPGSDKGYGGNTIIVNTGIGDPNAIAEAIDQVLTDAVQRGTLRSAAA